MYQDNSYTCLMCESNVPLKFLNIHIDRECEEIQMSKLAETISQIDVQLPNQTKPKKAEVYFPQEKPQLKSTDDSILKTSLEQGLLDHLQQQVKQPAIPKLKQKSNAAVIPKNNKQKKIEQNQMKQKHDQNKIIMSKNQKSSKQANLKPRIWVQRKQPVLNQNQLKQLKQLNLNKKPSSFLKQTAGKIQCVKCKKLIPLDSLDTHQFECAYQVECEYCGDAISVMKIQLHQKKCPIKKQWMKQDEQPYKVKKFKGLKVYSIDEDDYLQMMDDSIGDQMYNPQFEYEHIVQPQYQQTWQQFQQIADKKVKPKGLNKTKLNSLPLVCYRKSSIKKQKKQATQQQQSNQPCSICYLQFQQNQTVMKLKCKHYFHPQCVGKWFQQDDRCPMCKKHVQQ